jgi:NADPH2:quinone reductase
MRGWQVRAAGEPAQVLHQVELERPAPGPGQIRVQVEAAGIGLPDVLMCRGAYPLTPPLPFTPGQEATGTVTATGDGVEIKTGARVMGVTAFVEGRGSFAEECLMIADSAFPVPDGISAAESAGFWIPHLTGWIGLVERGQIKEGDQLVVLGAAGGSGIAAVQLGKALGARVIAVVSDQAKAEFCRTLGADATITSSGTSSRTSADGSLPAALMKDTDGHGADLIYDPVGGSQAEEAVTALARHGRLLAVGFASGRWPKLATHDLVVANTSLVGVFAGGYQRAQLDEIHARLSALVAAGRLRNAVTETVPFADLPEAVQRLADRKVIGKMVMIP